MEENKNGAESVLKDSHENSEPLITTAAPQSKTDDLTDLLSRQSAKEREERSQQDEIFNLRSRPTARERSLLNTFKSADGGGVRCGSERGASVVLVVAELRLPM